MRYAISMIKSIEIEVTFALSGFTLKRKIQPQKGLTAVVGSNGSGKTLLASETVRYLLYGKKALRGDASDYKSFTAKGDLVIKGQTYTVLRSPKAESVTDAAGTVQAVGAEAVTKKMIELMGYDLSAFDLFNAVTQKDTEAFSRATPEVRRKLVDRVVGLLSYRQAEEACRAQALSLSREAKAMLSVIVEPVEPEAVDDSRSSDELKALLDDEKARELRLNTIKSLLKRELMDKPVAPGAPAPTEDELQELQVAVVEYRSVQKKRDSLTEFLRGASPIGYKPDDLRMAEQHEAWKAELSRRGAKPEYDEAYLDAQEKLIELVSGLEHVKSLSFKCPECEADVSFDSLASEKPTLTAKEIRDERAALSRWKEPMPDEPYGALDSSTNIQADIRLQALVAEAQIELATLAEVEDKSDELKAALALEKSWQIYNHDIIDYKSQKAARAALEAELASFPTLLDTTALAEQYMARKMYETSKAKYDADLAKYETLSASIAEKTALAAEFQKGVDEIADARATVKAYLAPALSAVASDLLSKMTNGKLSTILVDEDMEIRVDGLKMKTLSGAGSTVANLALRLAFGSVLGVQKNFPVFIGDELDSDTDAERRYLITEALSNLSSELDQIIMITHRDVDVADHVISLENTANISN